VFAPDHSNRKPVAVQRGVGSQLEAEIGGFGGLILAERHPSLAT